MSLFKKALNTTIIYGKKYPIRSSKLLAEEYSVIMNTKGPYFRKNKMVIEDIPKTRLMTRVNHPYLTAGGRYGASDSKKTLSDMEVHELMNNMKNHLDNHYLNWKNSK